jgi:hypoxanthine-guanine phosphoribosyltransferase
MFFSDFLKYYPGKCEIAFLQVSSYSGTQSTGIVYKKMDLTKRCCGSYHFDGRHWILEIL